MNETLNNLKLKLLEIESTLKEFEQKNKSESESEFESEFEDVQDLLRRVKNLDFNQQMEFKKFYREHLTKLAKTYGLTVWKN